VYLYILFKKSSNNRLGAVAQTRSYETSITTPSYKDCQFTNWRRTPILQVLNLSTERYAPLSKRNLSVRKVSLGLISPGESNYQ